MADTTPARLTWFGSSGIRGPLRRIDTRLALRLGRALGSMYPRIVVGRDARLTGPSLEAALIAGLTASGADVTRAGVLPTPALAYASRHHDLGVQVTASHNPAPDNGFKLWTPTGSAPPESTLKDIEARMSEPPPERSWDQTGRVRDDATILHEYQDAVVRHVAPGGERPLAGTRIAVDCAHGAGALATPNILSRLGADLILLGGNPDGRFPDHPSEPTEEHLAGIRHVLTQDTCSFGLAHDGDADRTIFLHKDGSVIPQERLFAVLAAARGDRVVALPTDASGVVAQHLPQADIRITPVGDIHLSRAIEEGATFACEPSGTWFMRDWSPTPEGPYAAAYIATLLAKDPDILDQVRALPIQHRRTQKVPFPNGLDRGTVADRIVGMATALAGRLQATTVSDVDGVRIDTADGWVLIRPSGTEPVVRLTSESADQARADTLIETGHHELHRMLEAD